MTATAQPAIELRSVGKTFRVAGGILGKDRRVVAVDGVSFAVPPGGVLGVVGESGCGKSTLARLILGLLTPDSGDIAVEGQRIVDMDRKARARLIQPVFQDPFSSLNPLTRIRDIVAMPLQAQGSFSRAEIAKRVDEMLERVGLPGEMGNRLPAELSGGQRQRVAIARALVNDPQMIIADEPTGNLDSSRGSDVIAELRRLNSEGITLIIITHDPNVAAQAKRVVEIKDGKITERTGAR